MGGSFLNARGRTASGTVWLPAEGKDSMKSHRFCTNEFAEVGMLPLCRLQLLFRPRVLTELNSNQVHTSLIGI
eukprot:209957-Pelagomonas_calceolata.AAC.1